MRDLNRVVVSGNLGHDPKLEYTGTGKAVVKMSLACHRSVRQPDGSYASQPDWFRLVLWERQAEVAAEYARRGSRLLVEGRLQSRRYQDREGVDRTITEIIVSELYLLPNNGLSVQSGADETETDAEGLGGELENASGFQYGAGLIEGEDADELADLFSSVA
jgi:single-strand DNA-binding protein